jgi:LacI family gluconate utilization system Gnt-I transcriptional repressor
LRSATWLPRQHNDRAAERRLGYFAGLKELGLDENPSLAMETQSGFAGVAHAVASLLEAHPTIDAIFFAADVMAVGALFDASPAAGKCRSESPSPASTMPIWCAT